MGGIAPAGADAPAATPVLAEQHRTPKTQTRFKVRGHRTTKWLGGATQLATAPTRLRRRPCASDTCTARATSIPPNAEMVQG
eukprot:3577908-Pyramimonas_sp.AAC.1